MELPWYEKITFAEFKEFVIQYLKKCGMNEKKAGETFLEINNNENVFVREPHYCNYYSRRYGVMRKLEQINVYV